MEYNTKEKYYSATYFGYKVPITPKYVYRGSSDLNGMQRFLFTKVPYNGNKWHIVDSKTGYMIIRDLGYMSEGAFYRVCRLIMLYLPVKQQQQGKPRVSRLPEVEK